jgi:hypothetical protein
MADHILIEGVRLYDGEYPFDLENAELTTREWGWIKRLAGYLPDTIEGGAQDPELVIVFAAIAIRRAGKIEAREVPEVFDTLSDAPFGAAVKLVLEAPEEEPKEDGEDDALPPVPDERSSLNPNSSGPDSVKSSEPLTEPRNGSGTHESDTSASDRVTLET